MNAQEIIDIVMEKADNDVFLAIATLRDLNFQFYHNIDNQSDEFNEAYFQLQNKYWNKSN